MRLRFVSSLRPMPRLTGVLVAALILGQGAILSPLVAGALRGRVDTLQQWGAHGVSAVQGRLPTRPVRVNRTVPRVTPPPLAPRFSSPPTADEITRARVFREPLVPLGDVTRDENVALAAAVLAYRAASGIAAEAPFRRFLEAYPQSAWRASVLVNLATVVRDRGGFTDAMDLWDAAWALTKDGTTVRARAVADLAMAEWMSTAAMFGQAGLVQARGVELGARDVRGVAGARVGQALETAAMIADKPQLVLASGPQALRALLAAQGRPTVEIDAIPALRGYIPTSAGMTLAELQRMATAVGLSLRAVGHDGSATIPVPSVVHWKLGHYSAVVERADNPLPHRGHRARRVAVARCPDATRRIIRAPACACRFGP